MLNGRQPSLSLLKRFLKGGRVVKETCAEPYQPTLPLQQRSSKFGDNRAYRFPIDEFYIPLTTASSLGEPGLRSSPLLEATLAHRKLLVVGDTGSGKTTFLKRVAFHFCSEYPTGGPLPVRIEAAVLSTYIARQYEQKMGPADLSSPDWIPIFVGAQCEEKNRELGTDYFRARLKAGGCQVLIDGLDETSDELHRERIAKPSCASCANCVGLQFRQ